MPYFSIAYQKPESETLYSVLSQAESKYEAEKMFRDKNPGYEVISCWERPDYKPVESQTSGNTTPTPCVCGAKNIGLVHGVPSGRVFAFCFSCERKTAIKKTEAEAQIAWNAGETIKPRAKSRKSSHMR